MKQASLIRALCLGCALSLAGSGGVALQHTRPHPQPYNHPGHSQIGTPARTAAFDSIVKVTIREHEDGKMLFDPESLSIENGTIVKFVITNSGALEHEFFLGAFEEVTKHRFWMRANPDMRHDGANAVRIPSGSTAELIWNFSEIANLEYACLRPGHRDTGLWGVVLVHDHIAPTAAK